MAQTQLLAEFVLSSGAPQFAETLGRRHYTILLRLVDAPADAVTVIYQLDESFTNAIRMIPVGVPEFQEYITAFADFDIRVAVRQKAEINEVEQLISRKLSQALLDRYGSDLTPPISQAIEELKAFWSMYDRRAATTP